MKRCISHIGTPDEHEVRIVNSTDRELNQINSLPLLARFDNQWRMRKVRIYSDPENPDMVYTIGCACSDCETVVTHEPRRDFARAIAYWERTGKEYVFE